MFKDRNLNIFGTKYRIKFIDKVSDTENFKFGLCNHIQKTILVNTKDDKGNSLPPEEVKLTLLHEVIHAILGEGQYLHSNEDEPLVEWLARNINSLTKQNLLCWKI